MSALTGSQKRHRNCSAFASLFLSFTAWLIEPYESSSVERAVAFPRHPVPRICLLLQFRTVLIKYVILCVNNAKFLMFI
jgi:hypothetical protein